jgi:hypothetical protein
MNPVAGKKEILQAQDNWLLQSSGHEVGLRHDG